MQAARFGRGFHELFYGSDRPARARPRRTDLDQHTDWRPTPKLASAWHRRVPGPTAFEVDASSGRHAGPADRISAGQSQEGRPALTARRILSRRPDINVPPATLTPSGDPDQLHQPAVAATEGDPIDSANRTGPDRMRSAGRRCHRPGPVQPQARQDLAPASASSLATARRSQRLLERARLAGCSPRAGRFFHKTYCGNNGGIQDAHQSSATPSSPKPNWARSKKAGPAPHRSHRTLH